MTSILQRNMVVAGVLMGGTSVLVFLEARVFSEPPAGFWFFAMLLFALGGFYWANESAFYRIRNKALRGVLASALVVAVWLVAVFLVVTLGVNLKFALGGHV